MLRRCDRKCADTLSANVGPNAAILLVMDTTMKTTTKPRTTKVRTAKTIYRECACGENAHAADAEKVNGEWTYFYTCRNCKARIYEVAS